MYSNMCISWWMYFVTGLSYVLQQPSTARLARTKVLSKKSSHSYSSRWVIIKGISLVTEFNEGCLSLFNGVYVNPNVDVHYWKGWYRHYFFFLPPRNILTFRRPWISSSGFSVWRTLVAKEPILLTNCSTLWPEFLTLVKQLWGILSKASWLCLERHLFVLSSMFIHVRVQTCVTVFDVQKILANLIWINMNLLF